MTSSTATLLTQKLHALARHASDIAHFLWYQYYSVISPTEIADQRNTVLTLHCDRHKTEFTSRGRYLFYKGDKQSTCFCLECHYEFANDGLTHKKLTKVKDIAQQLEQVPSLGFTVSKNEPKDTQDFVINEARLLLTCHHCGAEKDHNINNIKTHIKTGDHLCCQHCEQQKKGKSQRISFEQAQQQIEKYQIDKESYRNFTTHCIHLCLSCGQRHWWRPQHAMRATCTRCGKNGGLAISVMPTIEDLDSLIKATSNWQLSLASVDIAHNNALFAKRRNLPNNAKLAVCCQQHPHVHKRISVKGLIHKLAKNNCKRCSAEDKQKYTANYLETEFKQQGHDLKIDLEKSQLIDADTPIPEGCQLTLTCAVHGTLPKTYPPYKLKKYLTEYKVSTPCRQCDPESGNTLNASRVRYYVESVERMKTHGALYRLVSTDEDIDAEITELKNKGESPYYSLRINIEVEAMLEPPLFPTTKKLQVSLPYGNFRKGKRGFMLPGHQCSWLAKFIAFLNIEWQLGLKAEATFEGLYSNKDNLLRIDFYQPTLAQVYEVDGSQHVDENQQIKSKAERVAKFAEQQQRDNLVNEFFKVHETIDLMRIHAYKKTESGNFKALTMKAQFAEALNLCQQIYHAFYHKQAPHIDRHTLLHTAKQNTSTQENTLLRISAVYDGEFFAQQISANNAITLGCQHGHYIKISNAKFYKDAKLEDKTAQALCWGCHRQQEINTAVQNLASINFKINDEAQLRKQYVGTLDAPLSYKNRGAKSTIMLEVISINSSTKQSPLCSISLARAQSNISRQLFD